MPLSNGTNHGIRLNVCILPERQQVKLRRSDHFRDILGRPRQDLALLPEAAVRVRGGSGL
jgi:hypothetical protein